MPLCEEPVRARSCPHLLALRPARAIDAESDTNRYRQTAARARPRRSEHGCIGTDAAARATKLCKSAWATERVWDLRVAWRRSSRESSPWIFRGGQGVCLLDPASSSAFYGALVDSHSAYLQGIPSVGECRSPSVRVACGQRATRRLRCDRPAMSSSKPISNMPWGIGGWAYDHVDVPIPSSKKQKQREGARM